MAEVTADGPGIGNTFKFSSIHLLTSTLPGSEMMGVPASEINETILFFFILLIILSLTLFSLNLW